MSKQVFEQIVAQLADTIGDDALDAALADRLNREFPPDGDVFGRLGTLCAEGEAEGWLMQREAGGIKYGRAVKPGAIAGRFSVDVVKMADIAGPHHVHTTGEIGAVMPVDGRPTFDGMAPGWYVYPPGSDHHPTVAGGEAYVLYLLPEGAIEFTGR